MVQWTEDLDATMEGLHSEDDRFLDAGEDSSSCTCIASLAGVREAASL